MEQTIDGEDARTKKQHDDGRQQKQERGSLEEEIRLAPQSVELFGVGGGVGDEHREYQGNRHDPRSDSKEQEQSAKALRGAGQVGVEGRHWDIQAAEEFGGAFDVQQLALSRLEKPPADVQTNH